MMLSRFFVAMYLLLGFHWLLCRFVIVLFHDVLCFDSHFFSRFFRFLCFVFCVCFFFLLVTGELPVFLQDWGVSTRGQVLSAAPQAPLQPDHSRAEPLPKPHIGSHGRRRRPVSAAQGPRAGRREHSVMCRLIGWCVDWLIDWCVDWLVCCTYAICTYWLVCWLWEALYYVGDPQGTLFEIPRVFACGVSQRPIDSLATPGDIPLDGVFAMYQRYEVYSMSRVAKSCVGTPSFLFSSLLRTYCSHSLW